MEIGLSQRVANIRFNERLAGEFLGDLRLRFIECLPNRRVFAEPSLYILWPSLLPLWPRGRQNPVPEKGQHRRRLRRRFFRVSPLFDFAIPSQQSFSLRPRCPHGLPGAHHHAGRHKQDECPGPQEQFPVLAREFTQPIAG